MLSSRTLAIAAIVAAGACNDATEPPPTRKEARSPVSLMTTATAPTVTIAGTARLRPYGVWSVGVTGGVPPYYVYWYWRLCYLQSSGFTNCTAPAKFAEAPGNQQVTLTPTASAQWIYVIAEVKDAQTGYITGVAQKFVLAALSGGSCPTGSVCCTSSAPSEFNFNEYLDNTGHYTGKKYTRRACGGMVIYEPVQ